MGARQGHERGQRIFEHGGRNPALDRLHEELNAAGIDTILDDRDARPGFKFADADLVGFPVRINIGERGLKEGKVEIKLRSAQQPTMVPLNGVVGFVRELLQSHCAK